MCARTGPNTEAMPRHCSARRILTIIALLGAGAWSGGAGAQTCPGDCDGSGRVTISELITAVRIALDGAATSTQSRSAAPVPQGGSCQAADANDDGVVRIEELIRAVRAALDGCPAQPTASLTGAPATATETPTGSPDATATAPRATAPSASPTPSQISPPTPTFTVPAEPTNTPPTPVLPLGMRRFTLDPTTSGITTVTTAGQLDTFGMTGYLELSAGSPDPMTGLAQIDVTGASDYLALDLSPGVLCIRPIVPAAAAGSIYCGPGVSSARAGLSGFELKDVGLEVRVEHRIGQIGEDFTLELCIEAGGTPEGPSDPHPGTCVGAVSRQINTAVQLQTPGTVVMNGLLAEVTSENGLPCGDEGIHGEAVAFDLISDTLRTIIEDVNGVDGETLVHEQVGVPTSCAAWSNTGSLGSLVHGTPIVHGAGLGDLELIIILRSLP